ncbi:hypothetical protein [Baekduia sp. Peel2402]|uniref:hypothetical protein n=1 Tax=Baekduia sp. Peel2402 TaxID=3458296 RepID=UPI00403E8633
MTAVRTTTIDAVVAATDWTEAQIRALAAERGITKKADLIAAIEEAGTQRPKKAPLTLSRRRALLRLAALPKGTGEAPTSGFRALPLDGLVEAGLATREEPTDDAPHGTYTISDAGLARAGETNPKWLTWTAAKVQGDGEGTGDEAA